MSHKHITIFTSTRNSAPYVEKSLASARDQNYDNYDHIFIDAVSTDETYKIAKEYEEQYPNLKVFQNKKRRWQAENVLLGNRMAKKNSILVTLDGDDWFKHENVLATVNEAYDEDTWMTYGSYENDPYQDIDFIYQEYPPAIRQHNLFRESMWLASHLRTWKKELFAKIKTKDLKDENGIFFDQAQDLAFMYPMLEMCGVKHSKRLFDILYVYNTHNPENCYKHYQDRMTYLEGYIRKMPKYTPLNSLES